MNKCCLFQRPYSGLLQSSNIDKNSVFVMFTVSLSCLNNKGKYTPTNK